MHDYDFTNHGIRYRGSFEIEPMVSNNRSVFNSNAGVVTVNAGLTRTDRAHQPWLAGPWQQWWRFSSRDPDGRPAWGFQAEIANRPRYDVLGGTIPAGPPAQRDATAQRMVRQQKIGFIQDVEYWETMATYQNISTPFRMIVRNATDRNPEAIGRVAHPWYNVEGNGGGPVLFNPRPPDPIVPALIDDSPEVTLRLFGHLSRPANPLRSVTTNGRFRIWLVVKNDDDPGDQETSLQFLYHLKVEFRRSWSYNNTGNPDAPSVVTFGASGSQIISEHAVGRGNSGPVFSDRVAHEHINKEVARLQYPR